MTGQVSIEVPPIPHLPPVWADVFGEDDFGIFAEFEVRGVRFVWRWIGPGRFWMGSPENEAGRSNNEGPRHEVLITRGFWMGETLVTQAQWKAVMDMEAIHSKFRGALRPVEGVSWEGSWQFADELNTRVRGLNAALPTEAQWEYACRAGTQGAFHDDSPCTSPTGTDPALDLLGWFDKNSRSETHDVKRKAANAWGLYDMHGNVWEWCQDFWDETAYAKRQSGVADPLVASGEREYRVVRNGSWRDQAQQCRSAYRSGFLPTLRYGPVGLRLSAGQELQPGAAEPL